MINTLIRKSARWSVASTQDNSPIISLLHANYGAGYLWALKDIATDKEIEEFGGIDIITFTKKITDTQDKASRRVTNNCPEFTGKLDPYLAKLAGNR